MGCVCGIDAALRNQQKSEGITHPTEEVRDVKKLSLKKLEKRIAPRYMPF